MREGIQQYIHNTKKKNLNVRVYKNVHVVRSRWILHDGIAYDLRLDAMTASRIFWPNSRRLIYGSLLLLSFNNFQSCVFVTVEDRSNIQRSHIVSVSLILCSLLCLIVFFFCLRSKH